MDDTSTRPLSGVLHHAIANGDITKVQSLLKQGVNANSPFYINEEILETASRKSMSNSIGSRQSATGSVLGQLSIRGSVSEAKTKEPNTDEQTENQLSMVEEVEHANDYETPITYDSEQSQSNFVPLRGDDEAPSKYNNNRKSLAESIDEKLNDDNEILIERVHSLRKSDPNYVNTEDAVLDEKPLKLLPRIKRKLSLKWKKQTTKKEDKEDDFEELYENIAKEKVRNVDDEQLNENYEGIAFFEAVREGMDMIVQTLLETSNNFQLNLPDENGFSPIMQAAWHGQKDCLQILLEHGGDITSKNATGCTAAHFAAGQGHIDCLELLVAHDDIEIDSKTKFGATSLILAAKGGHKHCVELLLEHGADPNIQYRGNQNALLFAAGNGHYECIQSLIGHNVQIDQANAQNVTPLMRAVQQGHNPCVVLLIDNEADLNIQDVIGRSAIHFAVEYGNPKALTLLLEAGANFELKTKGGSTAVNYAERFQERKCAEVLENHINLVREQATKEKVLEAAIQKEQKQVTCMPSFRKIFRRTKHVDSH